MMPNSADDKIKDAINDQNTLFLIHTNYKKAHD